MFKINLKLIIRNIKKHKLYSAITIGGFAIGLSVLILVYLYVSSEVSYDRFHSKAERIFRVTRKFDYQGGYNPHFARCPDSFMKFLPDHIPEIDELVRFQRSNFNNIKINENTFRDDAFFFADDNVFSVFDFPLKAGNPENALTEPNSIVISESIAEKYFSDANPMGQIVSLVGMNRLDTTIDFTVTGIMEDIPENSHIHFDLLASFDPLGSDENWSYVYLLTQPGTTKKTLQPKVSQFLVEITGQEDILERSDLPIQKLNDIHLYSHLDRELQQNGDIKEIYALIGLAVIVLLISIFNYINLSTARFTSRFHEIGIRKILGAGQNQITLYIISETIVFACLAFLVALGLSELLLPVVNSMTHSSLDFLNILNVSIIILFLFTTCVIGFLAGLYPALHISLVSALHSTRNSVKQISPQKGFLNLRRILVFIQFSAAIVLIVCTLVTMAQYRFMMNKDLGFDADNIFLISNLPNGIKKDYKLLKNLLLEYPEITNVSAVCQDPSQEILDGGFVRGLDNEELEKNPNIYLNPIDDSFVSTLNIPVIAGEDMKEYTHTFEPRFSYFVDQDDFRNYIQAPYRYFLINEKAAEIIGFESPEAAIGKEMGWNNAALYFEKGKIVGVVNDIHYSSIRNEIKPLLFVYEPLFFNNILIRYDHQKEALAREHITKKWQELFPTISLNLKYLYDQYHTLYEIEKSQIHLLMSLTFIALFLAFIGIFGLSLFMMEKRKREIGIRKVFGASVSEVSILLCKEFLTVTIFSIVAGIPIAWLLMRRWLQDYSFHISLNFSYFLTAGLLLLITTLATIIFQTIKAANANPVEIIKYE